jgi:2-keto-3-deoxy-L-rhamnonate aldolase RhmA
MNPIKARLAAGEFVSAAWAELGNADAAEIMVRHGWPLIVIDGEHGVGDIEQWVAVARSVEAAGGEVVLRVPDGSDTVLKRVLDRGFRSILVPQVNTVEQARSVAAACRYPGLGRRGYAAPIVRASQFGARPDYARQEAHEELLLMVQCEHEDAVANLAEIVKVPGIDMIFVGPNDLAASIDHLERMSEPRPQALLAEIEAVAGKAGMPLGTVLGAGRDWADLKALGYSFVIGPNDVSLLTAATREAATIRDAAVTGIAAPMTQARKY